MTKEELDHIIATMPPVMVRWGVARDLLGVLTIDMITGGDWSEREFRDVLRHKDCVLYVAICAQTEMVRGFAVYMNESDIEGNRILRVLNFAAGDPVARWGLIDKIRERARQHDRELIWNQPTY